MGHKDKAIAAARAHGFSVETDANPEEILSVLDASASSAAPGGGMSMKINRLRTTVSTSHLSTNWELRGPRELVQVMTFTVVAAPSSSGRSSVVMQIGEFKYQKGSLLTDTALAGSREITAFGKAVQSQLKARARDSGSGAASGTIPTPASRDGAGGSNPCPHCGAEVEAGYAKCGNCRQLVSSSGRGRPAAGAAPCPHCGEPVEAGYAKCGHCRKLVASPTWAPSRPAPTPVESASGATTPCPHCAAPVENGFAKCWNCRQLVSRR